MGMYIAIFALAVGLVGLIVGRVQNAKEYKDKVASYAKYRALSNWLLFLYSAALILFVADCIFDLKALLF